MARFHRVIAPAALLAVVAACGDDSDGSADPVDSGTDAAIDAAEDASDDAQTDAGLDVTADAGDDTEDTTVDTDMADVPVGECGPVAPRQAYVVTSLRFAREAGGVSNGFDVDGRDSDGADAAGCRKPDFTDETGREGIDNQFARILPAIEAAGGQALEGLIQNAINEGDILVMLDLESFDDARDDECVVASIMRGTGLPLLGADDRIQSGQTFDIDPEITPSGGVGEIVDGELLFGPVEFIVPAYVFFYEFLFPIEQGSVRANFHEDGTVSGVMGGGIPLDYLIETASGITGAGGAPDALISLAPGLADLFPDETGQCQAVSAALEFEAVPAFFYE